MDTASYDGNLSFAESMQHDGVLQGLSSVIRGWTYPPSYPLHQSWHLFNELHTYDIKANRWTCVNTGYYATSDCRAFSIGSSELDGCVGGLQEPITLFIQRHPTIYGN
ncbi:f-box only protein 42 [Holotrichia oblita]|uniref:F-box only protein 42 n=1 Tax=Holotrichia oblita TaxID=644536 RepID=A0ACB9THD5_HOLOL|nr:f-box only protein 42 [Holotrichia oblita]